MVKSALCSLVVVAAAWGHSSFHLAMGIYFLFWVILTLSFKNKAEVDADRARKRIATPPPPTRRSDGPSEKVASKLVVGRTTTTTTDAAAAVATTTTSTRLREQMSVAFHRDELHLIATQPTTDVFLSFALEYFGFVWITGMSHAILLAKSGPRGDWLANVILISNWANDIAALITGKSLKNRTTPLYPRISPNKSREGAIAGVIANAIVPVLMYVASPFAQSLDWGLPPTMAAWILPTFPQHATSSSLGAMVFGAIPMLGELSPVVVVLAVFGMILGVLGVIGDLLESLFKRTARIKDTGALIPGHGGILDRVDGLLVVYPFAQWSLFLFEKYVFRS